MGVKGTDACRPPSMSDAPNGRHPYGSRWSGQLHPDDDDTVSEPETEDDSDSVQDEEAGQGDATPCPASPALHGPMALETLSNASDASDDSESTAQIGMVGIARAVGMNGSPGNIAAVRMAIILGLHPDTEHAGRTLLAYASGNHASTEIMKLLIFQGANVNLACSMDAKRPLHIAAARGHTEHVQALLSAGADVHAQDWRGRTPLHHAAQHGRAPVTALLLNTGADVRAADESGRTPAHIALVEGHMHVFVLLMDAGAAMHAVDADGWTVAALIGLLRGPPTLTAFAGIPSGWAPGRMQAARFVFAAGSRYRAADAGLMAVLAGTYGVDPITAQDRDGFSAIEKAVQHKDSLEAVRWLVNCGVPPTPEAAFYAIKRGNAQALAELLRAGLPPDVEVNSMERASLLECAVHAKSEACVVVLRTAGAEASPECMAIVAVTY